MRYWSRVQAVLKRRAMRVAGRHHADDVQQRVALQFFTDPHAVMRKFTPERFANVALRTRADDHRRTERIQRGEGARMIIGDDGLRRSGREVIGLEAIDPDHDRLGIEGDTVDRIVGNEQLRIALQLLDPRIARALVLVEVHGHTVIEAAAMIGMSRAYVNRQLSAAKRLLAEVITAA